VFKKTLSEKIHINEDIFHSISYLDVEDFNFETKVKFIAEMFSTLTTLEKERIILKVIKYMNSHALPKYQTQCEEEGILEFDQYSMMI
jgi:predicted RNA methylase